MMIERIINHWIRRKTKNLTEIPLFTMTFDYRKYKVQGKKDSCTMHCHPDIANDEFVKDKLQEVVDYVRDNYDLDIFTKI
nr:MAG TPA: hypothetical protein [Bacteriophage sp.]